MVTKLTGENFEKEVLEAKGLVLVDFYADWCGPCKMLSPIVDMIAKEQKDIKVCKLNTDNAVNIAVKYNVVSIPTLLIFKDGELVKTSVGAVPKSAIEELISEAR